MSDLASRQPTDDVDAFRALVECAPAMLWLGDVDGRYVFLNRELRRFWGMGDADISHSACESTVHPDDFPEVSQLHAQALAARAAFELEARHRRHDGAYRLLRTAARPRFSAAGVFLGMAGVHTDITEQRNAEEALRRSSEQLQLALEASQGIGTWVWDVKRDLVVADQRMAEAFGVEMADAARGVPIEAFLRSIPQEDRARVEVEIERAVRERTVFRCEYRVRAKDGTVRWLLATGRCEFGDDGQPRRFPGAAVDITEHKAVAEHKELLAKELSHRIKNIFTVVQGMTSVSAREHPSAKGALDELTGRFRAMAAAYACVTPATDDVAVAGSLRNLLDILFAPYAEGGRSRFNVDAPDVQIGPKAASALALILHECATNAAKYGALSQDGVVFLQVALDAGRRMFHWRETGGPKIDAPPSSQGFGSRVIRSAIASLEADLDVEWAKDGLQWTMWAPEENLRL